VTSFRRKVELRSGPVLVLLARLPRVVPFLLVFGLLVGGLLLDNATGGVLLLVLAALLGWLLLLAWPALPTQHRVVRLLVLLLVVASAVGRIA
jgi:hypothetical protein